MFYYTIVVLLFYVHCRHSGKVNPRQYCIFSDEVHRYFLYDIISIDSIATKVNGVYSTHNVLTWALLNIRLVGIDS